MRVKYAILGGGPSGLSIAQALKKRGESSFVILEAESKVGGLCKSEWVDGAPLDTGGGHFLDVKRKEVLDFLFGFMPRDEWNLFKRKSTIRLKAAEIDYPLEANIWQLPIESQIDYLESLAQTGSVRGEPMPAQFSDWVHWKLGDRIAEDYMLPYNRKIWSIPLEDLGTYWLYKLPDVSFRDVLESCLSRGPKGSVPAHGEFLYPKNHGYGEVWRRMGEELGSFLIENYRVERYSFEQRTINSEITADRVISTIPWPSLVAASQDTPKAIEIAVAELQHSSIVTEYQADHPGTDAHWTYEPDENLSHHRILSRCNFFPGSKGYWTETNSRRFHSSDRPSFTNQFAYPLNTLTKPKAIETITTAAQKTGILSAGRWGRWEHMNSDVAVAEALALAAKL